MKLGVAFQDFANACDEINFRMTMSMIVSEMLLLTFLLLIC